jgi:hypothetical protein
MVKIGKADETVDVNTNQEKDKFKQHYKAVKKVAKDTQKVIELMKGDYMRQCNKFRVICGPSYPR